MASLRCLGMRSQRHGLASPATRSPSLRRRRDPLLHPGRPPAPDRARPGRPAGRPGRANLVAAARIAGRAFCGHPHYRAMNNGQPPGFGETRHSNGAAGTAAGGRGCSEAVRRNASAGSIFG